MVMKTGEHASKRLSCRMVVPGDNWVFYTSLTWNSLEAVS